jgi:hypothetical protein
MAEDLDIALQALLGGPSSLLSEIPETLGGRAGVFTIWYRDRLVFLGRARLAADEARQSNSGQADGVTGRLRGLRRQPPVGVQRVLKERFPDDFNRAAAANDEKRAVELLSNARCRYIETSSGEAAQRLFAAVKERLDRDGGGSSRIRAMSNVAECKHGLLPVTCSYCRAGDGIVYISGGGTAYHARRDCPSLEKGQNQVDNRGGTRAVVKAVRMGSPELDDRRPCLTCFE